MYKNILVATDLSPKSCNAIKQSIKYAHLFNSKIILINVHEEFLNKDEMIMSRVSVDKLQETFKKISLTAKGEILNIIENFKGLDIDTKIVLKEGKASVEILKICNEKKCDLIIIGSNGKDSISDYLLGTTTENVMNKSRIPVLVIPN